MAQNSDSRRVRAQKRSMPTQTPVAPIWTPTKTLVPKRADNLMSKEAFDRAIGDALSEDTWRAQYRAFAFECGFKRQYHTYRSDRSDPGYPDDVMLNVLTARMIYIEGKRESGKLSTDQVGWLDDLARMRDGWRYHGMNGLEVYVARPSDRAGLWIVFEDGDSLERLHQWCLDEGCERCQIDRARAVTRVPALRSAKRRQKKT